MRPQSWSGWAARALVAACLVGLPGAVLARAQIPPPFPHADHEGLFPLCTGCHVGIPTGAPAEAFPPPALCARCHDGAPLRAVRWEGFTARPDNVAFDHVAHARGLALAGDPDPGCEGCHSAEPEERMRVEGRPAAEGCLSCHAHAAASHFEDAKCTTCHVPLAASAFGRERIAALPRPADHEGEAFLARVHGPAAVAGGARCATCHVQQLCTACHVDPTLAAIQAIPPAPRAMDLPVFAARYPLPASHAGADWVDAHGAGASVAACATCHARRDCTVCHQDAPPRVVAALPEAVLGGAPGAGIRMRAPASHASAFFVTDHGGAAAAGSATCATCHGGAFCASCHEQASAAAAPSAPLPPRVVALLTSELRARPPAAVQAGPPPAQEAPAAGREFHPADFALRHAAAAYGQTMECASCHNVEAFCRSCHVEGGLAPTARLGPGFHDATAVWLLGHGQAARQGLESCASCHRQSDCVQCHSTVGAFQVNPHGRSFDARRAWARAPETCAACHLGNPLAGR